MESVPNLLSIKDVCRITTLSRTAINKFRDAGKFPKAVELGEKRIAFVANEVADWVQTRIGARGGV